MIFLLDTNVLSERTNPKPDARVMAFLRAVPIESVRISVIVLGEVAQGVENKPTPDLRTFLSDLQAMPLVDFSEAEAMEWGRLTSRALKAGHSVRLRDSMIAATASIRGWTVATRNTSDFAPLGVSVFNPWTDKLP